METCKTSSTVVVVDIGEHLLKVVGNSLLVGNDTRLKSETFRVGGHDWAVLYYPNGVGGHDWPVDGQFTSVFLQLVSTITSDVTVSFSFCLQDPASPTTGENRKSFSRKFLPSMSTDDDKNWGTIKFMSKADLAASGCLVDDCLVIKCTVQISKLIEDDDHKIRSSIMVPPSNLSTDFRNLLEEGHKADLTVKIGKSESFSLHTTLVGVRSPAFLAKLRNSMEESKQSSVRIEDMDAKVFEALRHYMYNDCLPGFMEQNTVEATSMAQDLLVPANEYGIERLKLMCVNRLSQSLNVNTVSSTLGLAEDYHCGQLKNCCLKYMTTDGERLRTIIGTKGFEQLMKKHPLIARDIFAKVVDKLNSQVVATPAPAPASAP
ncbi:unnamed protein product [Alopecurus aequalis]